VTDLAGSLCNNRALTSHLQNRRCNLACTGNEVGKFSRLRLVLQCLSARLRIHFELPVKFQALGWEKRSLSGSSPALHGQEPRRCWSFVVRRRQIQQRDCPLRLKNRGLEIFLVSSFNLYALFALLVIARLTQSTAPITTTRLPAVVAGNPNLSCAHRIANF
jgi:hypothetical protein